MFSNTETNVAIIGAGIAGIATAYYLTKYHKIKNITLIDMGQPLALTSAQSGENYRNWWPHSTMVNFMDDSIDLMEKISRDSNNRINMSRRGYTLATRRENIEELHHQLRLGYKNKKTDYVREYSSKNVYSYNQTTNQNWENVPNGVDIIQSKKLIQNLFPSLANDVKTVVHIYRAGHVSGQQLGQYMLENIDIRGGKRITGKVIEIEHDRKFQIKIQKGECVGILFTEILINAAGPFASKIADMLNVKLPFRNIFQQKLAFDDKEKSIPRNLPFLIDLDEQYIDWSDEEKDLIRVEKSYAWLTNKMPGGIHCRPDGGEGGTWIKLGWAYNDKVSNPTIASLLDENFPEIVLRGASRLSPALKTYFGRIPRANNHYGGWYTMTEENWPLIGPIGPQGFFIIGALSGFGTMAACASGKLCAEWVSGQPQSVYSSDFSFDRYSKPKLMSELNQANKGIL